jgi:hypothetical protein
MSSISVTLRLSSNVWHGAGNRQRFRRHANPAISVKESGDQREEREARIAEMWNAPKDIGRVLFASVGA